MDNVVDRAIYPLAQQEHEARSKRRMGIGVTGLANALEALGPDFVYGSRPFEALTHKILGLIANECYRASALLASEKGAFPLYKDDFLASEFVRRLDDDVFDLIEKHGIRNSHLTSIAPTGTISLSADNVSSGIEPVFSYGFDRIINMPDGQRKERVDDYGVRVFGVEGKTSDQCSIDDHLSALRIASYWSDSAVSKTCNIGSSVTFEQFKDVYRKAWADGAKGCTTFRAAGKRMGILQADEPAQSESEGAACYIDPETGNKSCG